MSELKFTPSILLEIADELSKKYHAKILNKKDSNAMIIASHVVAFKSPLSSKEFMERFSTTIGNRIYLNFTLGDPESRELWSQLRLLGHEFQHIVQLYESLLFTYRYLKQSGRRSLYEVDALHVNFELRLWYQKMTTGKIENLMMTEKKVGESTDRLFFYACSADDILAANNALMDRVTLSRRFIKDHGICIHPMSRQIIKMLKAKGVV